MAYLHNNLCYGAVEQLYQGMAASCPVATSDGKAMTCEPTATGYKITTSDGVTSSVINVSPPLIDCMPQYVDAITLSWQCAVVILIAWGILIAKRQIT